MGSFRLGTLLKRLETLRGFLSFNVQPNRVASDGAYHTVELIRNADRSVMISAGDPPSPFLYDVEVVMAIRHALEKGVSVKVYAQQPMDHELPTALHGSSILTGHTLEGRHFVVIDDKHVRIEMRHSPGDQSPAAVVFKDAPLLARDISSRLGTQK